jgi:hypothetical protein
MMLKKCRVLRHRGEQAEGDCYSRAEESVGCGTKDKKSRKGQEAIDGGRRGETRW